MSRKLRSRASRTRALSSTGRRHTTRTAKASGATQEHGSGTMRRNLRASHKEQALIDRIEARLLIALANRVLGEAEEMK